MRTAHAPDIDRPATVARWEARLLLFAGRDELIGRRRLLAEGDAREAERLVVAAAQPDDRRRVDGGERLQALRRWLQGEAANAGLDLEHDQLGVGAVGVAVGLEHGEVGARAVDVG